MRPCHQRSSSRARRLAAASFLAAAASLWGGEALAHGGAERSLTVLPPAPPGDGAKAEALLREIAARIAEEMKAAAGPGKADAAEAPRTGKAAKIVAEPVEQAKRALSRAHGARAAGDAAHARQLDGLALEHAETARDLLRAVAAEAAAVDTAQKARDAATRLERARALLEETQARYERAAAELVRLQAEAREAAAAAERAEQGRIEASKKAGAKGAAKAGGAKAAPATKQGAR